MHLKPRGKASRNGGKAGGEDNAHHQRKQHLDRYRKPRKVENMSKHRACVDALVHDNRSGNHAHANHTSDGQVCTGQKDQARNAQRKEHSGRCLLKDIQHIVVGQKLNALNRRRDGTQGDENNHDGYVQTILQQEIPAVEGVLIVLHLLSHILAEGEFRHAQHIDHVVFVPKRRMLPVLGRLKVLLQLHLGIKEAVLVNVLLVLDLALILQLGDGLLVLLLQLGYSDLVFLLGLCLLLHAAGCHRLEILLVVVGLDVCLALCYQLGYLVLILGLHRLGLFQICLQLGHAGILFLLGIDVILL